MGFTLSQGLAEADLPRWLAEAAKKYGRFDDGRVNYKKADTAPTVMITVLVGKEILLVKRGQGLADAENVWSTVNGFIDEPKPVAEIAANELSEELSLKIHPADIKVARSYTVSNPQGKRKYIVFPCLVELDRKPEIILDREHTDFAWTARDKIDQYEMLKDTPHAIDSALSLV